MATDPNVSRLQSMIYDHETAPGGTWLPILSDICVKVIRYGMISCNTLFGRLTPDTVIHSRGYMRLTCPECDGEVNVDHSVMISEVITCPECSAKLEVISLNPIELALAPEIEEDWGE
jgi:alpha-aminoadipate/glutamate carrier protein LysW